MHPLCVVGGWKKTHNKPGRCPLRPVIFSAAYVHVILRTTERLFGGASGGASHLVNNARDGAPFGLDDVVTAVHHALVALADEVHPGAHVQAHSDGGSHGGVHTWHGTTGVTTPQNDGGRGGRTAAKGGGRLLDN